MADCQRQRQAFTVRGLPFVVMVALNGLLERQVLDVERWMRCLVDAILGSATWILSIVLCGYRSVTVVFILMRENEQNGRLESVAEWFDCVLPFRQ